MKTCNTCQSDNRETAEFCGTCGAKFELEMTKIPVSEPLDQSEVSTKPGKSRLRLVIFSALAVLLATAIGAFLWFSSGTPVAEVHPSESAGSTYSSSAVPTPTAVESSNPAALNSFGIPTSCGLPAFRSLASDFLKTQMHSKGEISISSLGYSASVMEANNNGGSMPSTTDSARYKHLACSFSADLDKYGYYNHEVKLDFDASYYNRDGQGGGDEQEINLNVGEDLALFYPSGGGYEEGGGLEWRIWMPTSTIDVNTWSFDGAHGEVLNPTKFGDVVAALKGSH
jgi:hypothetical protein